MLNRYISFLSNSGKSLVNSVRPAQATEAAEGVARTLAGSAKRELGVMGKAGAVALSPLLVPMAIAARSVGWGIRGYKGAFNIAPITTGLATAAIAAPIAYHMLKSDEKPRSHAREQMADIDAQQQQTGQALDVMQQVEAMQPQPAAQPVPQVAAPAAMNMAGSTISAANDAVYDGRVDDRQRARA